MGKIEEKIKKIKLILVPLFAIALGITTYFITQYSHKEIQKTVVTQKIQTKKARKVRRRRKRGYKYAENIQGKITTLKILSLDDAFNYYTMFSEKVRKFFEFPEKMTFSEVEYQIKSELKDLKAGEFIGYTIWDNKDNKLIGNIQIRSKENSKTHPGQLSMWLNEKYWGGGRIQDAMLLISKEYFDMFPNEDSYNAYVREWNIRSIKSMEKFGFKKTGITKYKNKPNILYEISRDAIDKKLDKYYEDFKESLG